MRVAHAGPVAVLPRTEPMRYDYAALAPTLIADLRLVTLQLHATVVDPHVRVLVELRVSQLNGCAFCIDKHAREAARIGIPQDLVVGLCAWRDDERFDGRLRVALAWADALTMRLEGAAVDRAYADLPTRFSPEEIVHLTIAIALTQAWNCIAGGLRRQPVPSTVGGAPSAARAPTVVPSPSSVASPA